MLYTLAEAAKATGLDESLIVSAIKDGQVTSVKDLSREWHIEDEELHRLYLSIVQEYCKRKSQQDPRSDDATISEAHISGTAERTAQQTSLDMTPQCRTGPEQGESTRSASEDKIKIDDRDRISVSDPQRTPGSFARRGVLVALACIAVPGSFYLLGQTLFLTRNVSSPAQVLGSDTERTARTTLAAASVDATTGALPPVPAGGIDNSQNSKQSSSQISSPSAPIAKKDSKESHSSAEKSRTNPVANRVPFPETRPTSIKGWTLRSVVGGTATLEGPGGIWKAARGDTVPGLGKVDSITMWGSRWIVSTSRGLVTTQ
jgi:hypothetical protein